MINKYFRILAPFTNIQDVPALKDAGVDELYCGYVTEKLTKKWPLAFGIINRRGEGQSFEDYHTFKKATELACKHNLPVYVTINGLYTPEQYPLLLELTDSVERLEGVKGIIIADLGFLLTLRKNKFTKEIHLSTGGTCFNSYTADFFYNLGAKRVILDRQLASYEIEDIIAGIKTEIGIEIFILNEGCGGFIDGYCTCFHCSEVIKKGTIKKGLSYAAVYHTGREERGCSSYFLRNIAKKSFKTFSAASYKEKPMGARFQRKKHYLFGCRMCDLYGLNKSPVKSLKIVGRGNYPEYSVQLVNAISRVVSWLADNAFSKKEYERKCKDLFFGLNNRPCTQYDCYFSPRWVTHEN